MLIELGCRGERHGTAPKSVAFSTVCPDPAWLHPNPPTGCTHDEMQALYLELQKPEKNPQLLPSAAFASMKRCSENPEVVLYALMLVAQRGEYVALETCATRFIERDFSFRSQSVADSSYHVAGAVNQVGQALITKGATVSAARLYARLFHERGAELPAVVAQASGYYYAQSLAATQRKAEAMSVLGDLIDRFDTPEESRLRGLRDQLGRDTLPPTEQDPEQVVLDSPDVDSPHGTKLTGFRVAAESPQSVELEVAYEFHEGEEPGSHRITCDFRGGGSDGHSGSQPGAVQAGTHEGHVRLTAVSGPAHLESDKLHCLLYRVGGASVAERTFAYRKHWFRRP